MKKSFRRALWAGAIVAVSAAAIPMVQATAAEACAPTWTSSAVYVKDNKASLNGVTYTAKWWTQGENPAQRSGQWDVWINNGACGGTTNPTTPPPTTRPPTTPPVTTPPPTTPPPTTQPPTTPPPTGDKWVVGYFAEWGVYQRQYFVKNIDTSGSASKITHILYSFANSANGQCSMGDSYAATDLAHTAAQSVDGVADTWDQPLRGNFNQLLKLKKKYPNIKVLYSVGGWTWSGGFTQAAQNPAAFANSCYNLLKDPKWAGVFDGIDIDWEYPNACGLSCDTSGPQAFSNVMTALRAKFGDSALLTAAITADGSNGGKIDATDYAGAFSKAKMNKIFPMTYDYFGAFNAQGPTAPHSPLNNSPALPTAGFNSEAAINKLIGKGIPAKGILLGIGFYGRGWTGVTQDGPGGTATGPATGIEPGVQDYKVLKTQCPSTGLTNGTAYAKCGNNWWSYDTPATIGTKLTWAKNKGLGGAFFWEFSGDTTNGELITAIKNNV